MEASPPDWYVNTVTQQVEWFEGNGKVEGYTHIGPSAFQDNGNGTTTIYNDGGTKDTAINLEGVTLDKYTRGEGTYFDRSNYGRGENPYSPYIPDAIGISLSATVNTGILGSFGGTIGGAIDVHNDVEGYVGGFGDIGYIGSFGIPRISFGLSINLHDSYIGNDNSVLANSIPGGVLQNLGGTSKTYSGGLGLTGGYSYSSNEKATEKSDYGVETKSIGLSLGINAQKGMSKSWTFTEIYNNMKK